MYLNTPKEVTRAHLSRTIISLTEKDKDEGTPNQGNIISLTEKGQGPAFPDQAWDAGDVGDSRSKRSSHTRLFEKSNDYTLIRSFDI